jgi:hypothetical protein
MDVARGAAGGEGLQVWRECVDTSAGFPKCQMPSNNLKNISFYLPVSDQGYPSESQNVTNID